MGRQAAISRRLGGRSPGAMADEAAPFAQHRPVARLFWRQWRAWRYRLLQRRTARRVGLTTVAGLTLVTMPQVFHPRWFGSSAFLAERLGDGMVPPGATVLDLGTGTGIGAIAAARWAGRVTAVDINPEAVRCARINVSLHRLEGRVEVRAGDLFAPVAGETFDVVLFNPPFYRGMARDAGERAWRSPDLPERFAAELGGYLAPEGSAVLVLSTNGELAAFHRGFQAHGWRAEEVARRDAVSETFLLYRLTGGRVKER